MKKSTKQMVVGLVVVAMVSFLTGNALIGVLVGTLVVNLI